MKAVGKNGFTLIESLVALAILGIIVGVLVNVHLQTLRAESFSRLRLSAVFESETILSQSLSGMESSDIVDQASRQGWSVTVMPMTNAPGAGVWNEWRIAASNAGAPVVTLHLRANETVKGTHAK